MFIHWDYGLFQTINHFTRAVSFLNPAVRFFAENAQNLFMMAVIVYWFLRSNRRQNRQMIVQALASVCVGLGASGIIGHFFYRDRPFVHHAVTKLIAHPANASFPSDHAICAFAVALSIWIFRRKAGWYWLMLASCIAVSRVWAGVHYPSDIIGGALIGFLSSLTVHRIVSMYKPAQVLLNKGIGIYEKAESAILVVFSAKKRRN